MKEIMVCDYHGRDNEPCYGEIDSFFDEVWYTFCEGHKAVPRGGFYVPQDPVRRWIFSQQNKKIRQLEYEVGVLRDMVKYADDKLSLMDVKEIEIPEERLEILYA